MTIAHARSMLFVPADRPDRFAKAVASGADAIVLDLEDAIPPEGKDTAREHVRRWRADGGAGVVRVNGADTAWHDDDVAVLGDTPCTVLMAKASDAGQVRDTLSRLPAGSCVVPILETAAGILAAREIAAVPGVVRLAFGNGDLAAELGVDHSDTTALAFSRSSVVLASAAASIASPVDGVTTAFTDDAALTADTEHASRLGFTGKMCIHPRQVPVVHRALEPAADEIRRAREIVDAAGSGAVGVADGRMIDGPIVTRARQLLTRAGGDPR